MKKSAYILNIARGGIINEEDLKYALKNNIIAGAAIDAYVDAHLADFSENYVLDTKTNTISLKLYRKF